MAENDKPNLVTVTKDGKIVASPPSGKIKKVFGVRAQGIKDEGGPRRGDLSCAIDTINALYAAGMAVSTVGLGLVGKGEVSWDEGWVEVGDANPIEEVRESENVYAVFNTVDESSVPDHHLLSNGHSNGQALVEISKALTKSSLQVQGDVISAALVIGEIKPASTQTLPDVETPAENLPQQSNIIEIGTGKWAPIPDKKEAA